MCAELLDQTSVSPSAQYSGWWAEISSVTPVAALCIKKKTPKYQREKRITGKSSTPNGSLWKFERTPRQHFVVFCYNSAVAGKWNHTLGITQLFTSMLTLKEENREEIKLNMLKSSSVTVCVRSGGGFFFIFSKCVLWYACPQGRSETPSRRFASSRRSWSAASGAASANFRSCSSRRPWRSASACARSWTWRRRRGASGTTAPGTVSTKLHTRPSVHLQKISCVFFLSKANGNWTQNSLALSDSKDGYRWGCKGTTTLTYTAYWSGAVTVLLLIVYVIVIYVTQLLLLLHLCVCVSQSNGYGAHNEGMIVTTNGDVPDSLRKSSDCESCISRRNLNNFVKQLRANLNSKCIVLKFGIKYNTFRFFFPCKKRVSFFWHRCKSLLLL